jgi:hypothetical protein
MTIFPLKKLYNDNIEISTVRSHSGKILAKGNWITHIVEEMHSSYAIPLFNFAFYLHSFAHPFKINV